MTNVASRVRGGLKAFAARNLLLQALRMVSTVVLARLLFPEDFAAFGAVAALISFAQFGVDLGVGAALVQGEQEPDETTLRAAFTMQQLMAWAIVVVAWFGAEPLIAATDLPSEATWMLRVYACTTPIFAARLVPTVHMLRDLRYRAVVLPEVLETVSGYLTQIALALLGFGAWALILGAVVRSMFGTAGIYYLHPWRPRTTTALGRLRTQLRFGLPYQLNVSIQNLRGFIPSWLLVLIAGAEEAGTVLWSLGLTGILWQIAEIADRLLFPAVARLKQDKEALSRLIVSVYVAALVIPGLGAALAPTILVPVIRFVFSDRWVPAAPVLELLLWSTPAMILAHLIGSMLNALGRPRSRLALSGLATGMEVAVTLALAPILGGIGYALARMATSAVESVMSVAALGRSFDIVGSALLRIVSLVAVTAVAVLVAPSTGSAIALGILVSVVWGIGVTRGELLQFYTHVLGTRNEEQ